MKKFFAGVLAALALSGCVGVAYIHTQRSEPEVPTSVYALAVGGTIQGFLFVGSRGTVDAVPVESCHQDCQAAVDSLSKAGKALELNLRPGDLST